MLEIVVVAVRVAVGDGVNVPVTLGVNPAGNVTVGVGLCGETQ